MLRTDNVDAQLGDGLPAELVLGVPRATIDQACDASAVILLGPDLKEELPVLYLRLRTAALEAKLPLIELAEQRSGLSRYAAITLLHRPGEAHLVARALAGASDPTADVGGVAAAEVTAARQLLKDIGEKGWPRRDLRRRARSPVARLEPRPRWSRPRQRCFHALPGARFLTALRRGNVHGALDMGLAPGVLPGRVGQAEGRAWYADAWGELPEAAGMDTTQMLLEAAEGRLAGLILLGADPLSDFPDRALARKGLQGAGMVVAVDCYLSESCAQADVILPAATYAERPGSFTNMEGRVLRLGQKVTAPGVAWPDWMIAVELAERMGSDLGFDHLEGIWDEIERLSPAHTGVTSRLMASLLAKDGVVVPLGAGDPPLQAPPHLDPMAEPGIIAAETHWVSRLTAPEVPHSAGFAPGEVERGPQGDVGHADPLAPGEAGAAADDHDVSDPGLSLDFPGVVGPPAMLRFEAPPAGSPAPPADAYSLRLVASRRLWDAGAGVQHSPHLAGLAQLAGLRAHPADLQRLGHQSGGRVRVVSPRGTAVVTVEADPGVPRGSVAMGFNLPGEQAAELIDATSAITNVRLDSIT